MSRFPSCVELAQDGFDGQAQGRQFVRDDVPHDLRDDVELRVHDDISHASDVPPLRSRLHAAQVIRDLLGCLTHDLEVVQDGVQDQWASGEGSAVHSRCVRFYAANGLEDVLELDADFTRHRRTQRESGRAGPA